MSETTETVAETPAPDAPDDATAVAAPEPTETTTQGEGTPDPAPAPADKKPPHDSRRYARLSAQLAEQTRRAEAAEALLKTGSESDDKLSAAEVERRASELADQREFDRSRRTLIAEGIRQFGEAEWNERTAVLGDFGAVNNPNFMRALVDIPNGAELVTHLAEDTAELERLLAKSPVAMVAEMGRMAAKLEAPKTVEVKAHTRAVSQAPRPPAPVVASANPVVDLYDPKLAADPHAFKAALQKQYGPKFGTGAR